MGRSCCMREWLESIKILIAPAINILKGPNGEQRSAGSEMSPARIREIIDAYVQAAARAQRAGLDGIELHGCHSYLICQF